MWQLLMHRQINVNGSSTHPVFQFLKQRLKGSFGDFIKWSARVAGVNPSSPTNRNFSKFLCDTHGRPFRRYGPKDAPFSFEDDIRSHPARHCFY